ncbi:Alpha/Beta hydrolase protein [Mycena floridula]|nr:Alpha/Beta hydrolase protein [Mycena floridula]
MLTFRIPLLLAFSLPTIGIFAQRSPVVDLGYAKYEGTFDSASNNTRFLGIRYAAPPIGPLRFHAPQNPVKVEKVQPATDLPPRCLQADQGYSATSPFRSQKRTIPADTEDCLFLSVYVPGNLSQAKDLEVVVWIHGGGYVAGGSLGLEYLPPGTEIQQGDDLVHESGNNVVAVVIQYRLGLFGFLPGEAVRKGGALNAGLLDQQFALRWVQNHINQFGGDPTKVTIWGLSAGAGSVLQHLVANGGKTTPPLFRGAITSSTFLPSQYAFNDTIPETLYNEVVSQTKCSTDSSPLECLRKVDAASLEVINVNINNSGFFGTFVFVPVVDGTLIRERPTVAISQGKLNGNALYSVTNTFEGNRFVNASTADTVQIAEYLSQLFPLFTSSDIKAAAAQYKALGSPFEQAAAIMGEAIFVCPTYFLLRGFRGPSFKGEFATFPGLHGIDEAYYFPSDNTNGIPPYNNTAFDKAFPEGFLTFVRELDPNKKFDINIIPRWSTWDKSSKVEMLFNKTEDGAPDIRPIATSKALLNRCNFWESVSARTAQ